MPEPSAVSSWGLAAAAFYFWSHHHGGIGRFARLWDDPGNCHSESPNTAAASFSFRIKGTSPRTA